MSDKFSAVAGPVGHYLQHPSVHRAWSQWSEDETLHLAGVYNNPFRWDTRRKLFHDFRRHIEHTPNVRLHVGELAHGERPFEVTDANWRFDSQFRTRHEFFFKENLLNATIRKSFPPDWKYGGYSDGDMHFTRHDWALEAIHLLQHYDFVQLFSTYSDLTTGSTYDGNIPMHVTAGFAFNYCRNGCTLPDGWTNGGWRSMPVYSAGAEGAGKRYIGATGGAWAWRRDAFDRVGGLLDKCILGHGDWFMAFGLVSEPAPDMRIGGYTPGYQRAIYKWQKDAARLGGNIGYVAQHAIHNFHGSKTRRGYSSRDGILVEHQFDPDQHLITDWQGLFQLAPGSDRLRDAIRLYFLGRDEDDPNLYGSEKEMV